MPIEKIELKKNQGRIFQDSLSEELNHKHKLYKLRLVINWDQLIEELSVLINVKEYGRTRKSIRVMVGLSLLQAMYNYSDCLTSATLDENVYWQYFCGYEYGGGEIGVSDSSIRRFRKVLGAKGHEIILKELTRVGLRVGAYKKKDLDSVIIDTTVQNKNVKYPYDIHLLGKAREELVKLSSRLGIKLNETYAKKYKYSLIKLWRYKADSKSKQRRKVMNHVKILVGRLIRRLEKELINKGLKLSAEDQVIFNKIKHIYAQSFLTSQEKKEYKEQGNKVIYSFHAEEVECIGKGKLNTMYVKKQDAFFVASNLLKV